MIAGVAEDRHKELPSIFRGATPQSRSREGTLRTFFYRCVAEADPANTSESCESVREWHGMKNTPSCTRHADKCQGPDLPTVEGLM